MGEVGEIKLDGFTGVFQRNWDCIHDKEKALFFCSRTEQEVEALQALGISAIGIDLVPFESYLCEGDIHNLKLLDDELN